MKNHFLLSFLVLVLGLSISNCGDQSENPIEGVDEMDEIDKHFQKCYHEDDYARKKSDAVLISIFGQSLFDRNIRVDLANSFLNCEVDGKAKLIPYGDTNYCGANTFDLVYSIQQNSEEIYSFRMVAGNEMVFEPVSAIVEDQLWGYQNLLEGKFTITYDEAKRIAIENGVNFEDSDLELVQDENESIQRKTSYHWEAELEYDHNSMVLLLIDVMSGETSKEVLMIGEQ